jgi:hypothetical protein
VDRDYQRFPVPIEGDSWSNWEPDPERAFREHNATLEPYALMSREEILERMQDARGGKEWEFLTEFLLDKFPCDEQQWERIATLLASYLEFGRHDVAYAEAASSAPGMRTDDSALPDR